MALDHRVFRSRGFTLVELLVALVLGLMLSAGIVNIYLQNKQNYLQDEELARMQENARYAMGLLKRELTMAGFVAGLGDYSGIAPANLGAGDCTSTGLWALNVQGDIFELINNYGGGAFTTQNGTTWNCLTEAEIQSGSDIISAKRTADESTLEDGGFTGALSAADDEQYYLRAEDNSIPTWSYIVDGGSIPTADISAGNGIDYWEFYSQIFYLRNFSRTAGDGIPTLCIEKLVGNAMATECLVEGIEDMQIEVGVDTNDDSVPDFFDPAPTSAEIQEAVVLRIYLLVRSVDDISNYTNDKTYTLGGKKIAAKNDGFMRRVFSTTIQMRNAKLPNA
ncbi:prepilin-type N-terminal cleavage/methylation domain-containing protein [Proteobacteria bacterium 005FR1]|nr:prepilin-type N-terminal cleavage/methylation domain-containing protein [Proteobacteria bacterium 005FR1]